MQRAQCTRGVRRSFAGDDDRARRELVDVEEQLAREAVLCCAHALRYACVCVYMCTWAWELSRRVSSAQRTQRSHPPVRPHSPRPRAPTRTPASSCASAGWQMGLGMPYGTYRTEGTYRGCVRGVWGALYPQVEYPVSRLVRASSDLITVMPSQRLRCRRYLLGWEGGGTGWPSWGRGSSDTGVGLIACVARSLGEL